LNYICIVFIILPFLSLFKYFFPPVFDIFLFLPLDRTFVRC